MLWHAAAASLVALAMGFAGGWQVRAWKAGADDVERIELEDADARQRARAMDRAAEGYEGRRAAAQARAVATAPEERRVTSNPAYAAACLDDDGLRLLADDAAASNARRQLAPALPGDRRAD